MNDHEIILMAEHFRNSAIILRFIEYMDVGCSNSWRMDEAMQLPDYQTVIYVSGVAPSGNAPRKG